ncbi:MAG: hypothetical protein IJ300_03015 [Clostridia bacterium]|nr:hypothetical protein [Clostridia bacterium]
MKRIVTLVFVTSIVLSLFCGCQSTDSDSDPFNIDLESVSADNDSVVIDSVETVIEDVHREHQDVIKERIEYDMSNILRVSLPEAGLSDLFIVQSSSYVVIDSEVSGKVFLLGDDRYGTELGFSDHYLAVEIGDDVYIKDLSMWDGQGCYIGNMQLLDVDGDGDCEIILQQLWSITGGAGDYLSRVYDFKNGEIIELFVSKEYVDKMYVNIDTGFSINILENKKYAINNKYTEYSEEFPFYKNSEKYYKFLYDENGVPYNYSIMVDDFFEFKAVDIDYDGVYEIRGVQYVSLVGHLDGIGRAITVLKYDTEAKSFKIISADFEPYVLN